MDRVSIIDPPRPSVATGAVDDMGAPYGGVNVLRITMRRNSAGDHG
jgi:hypothetical protein